jgi:fibronectin-binding autotransporter adhesin
MKMLSKRPTGQSFFPRIRFSTGSNALLAAAVAGVAIVSTRQGKADVVSTFDPQNFGQFLDTDSTGFSHNAPNDPTEWGQSQTFGIDGNNNPYLSANSNWTTPLYPDNANGEGPYDAVINGFVVELAVPGITTVNTLDLEGGAALTIDDNNSGGIASHPVTLEIAGASLTDNGSLTIQGAITSPATLAISSTCTLSGTGTLTMTAGGNSAQLFTTGSGALTNNLTSGISGYGVISANLTNTTTVNANSSGNTLFLVTEDSGQSVPTDNPSLTNTGTLEATGDGIMSFGALGGDGGAPALTVTNTGGTISAAGGTVNFYSTVIINGGTLSSTAGSGFFNTAGATTLNGVTLTAGTTFTNDAPSTVNLQGNITNNGTLIGQNGVFGPSLFLAIGDVTLGGTGSINLGGGTLDTPGAATITVGSSQTINGPGTISAAMTNNETINAPSGQLLIATIDPNSGAPVTDDPTFTNAGTLEATGGTLLFSGGPLTVNNAGGTITANGGAVNFEGNVTVTGGTLASTGASQLQNAGGTTTLNGVTLTKGSTFTNAAPNTLVFEGSVTNNGTILGQTGFSGNALFLASGNATLGGTGSLNLQGATLDTTGTNTITVGTSQTINGSGVISAAMTNNGTIDAPSGQLLIAAADPNSSNPVTNTPTFTNAGTLESTGGTLLIGEFNVGGPLTVNNAGGTITANGGNVDFQSTVTINGGTLTSTGANELQNVGGATTLNGVTITAGSYFYDGAPNALDLEGTITNNGTIYADNVGFAGPASVTIVGDTNLNGSGELLLNAPTFSATAGSTLTQGAGHTIAGRGTINASIVNNGTIESVYGNGNTLTLSGASYTNNGAFIVTDNTTLAMPEGSTLTNYSAITSTLTGGSYQVLSTGNGATLSLPIGPVVTNAADVTLSGANSVFAPINSLVNNQGGFHVLNGQTFTTTVAGLLNSGTVEIGAAVASPATPASVLTIEGSYVQSGGVTIVNGQLTIVGEPFSLNGGTLKGSGTVTGEVDNVGGTVSPGNSPGLLSIDGDYSQSLGAVLDIEIAGGTPGTQYDQLAVSDVASLDGTLDVSLLDGFTPSFGESFVILTSGAELRMGTFDSTNLPAGLAVSYTSDSVVITAVPEPVTAGLLTIAAAGMLAIRRSRR